MLASAAEAAAEAEAAPPASARKRLRSFLLSFPGATDSDALAVAPPAEAVLAVAAFAKRRAFSALRAALSDASPAGAAVLSDGCVAAASELAAAAAALRCAFRALRAALSRPFDDGPAEASAPADPWAAAGAPAMSAPDASVPLASDAPAAATAASAARFCFLSFFLKLLPALSEPLGMAASEPPLAGGLVSEASAESASFRFLFFFDFKEAPLSAMIRREAAAQGLSCVCGVCGCAPHVSVAQGSKESLAACSRRHWRQCSDLQQQCLTCTFCRKQLGIKAGLALLVCSSRCSLLLAMTNYSVVS